MRKIETNIVEHLPHPDATGDASCDTARGFRTVFAHDADELARNLTDWEQSYDQLTCGRFHGALDEVRMPDMQVFRETISQSVRQSCRTWPGALWFGFPDQGECIRINGRRATSNAVMLRAGGQEFELLTPCSHAIHGVVVCEETLRAAARRSGCEIDWDGLQAGEVMRADPAARARCVQALAALLASQRDDGAARNARRRLPHFRNLVIEALLAMLDRSAVEPAAAASFQRRVRIVTRVRDYILAHRDQPITMPDLCEQAHVSRRTLQYCFEDVLGISPTLYLRRVRLNGVRRQLLERGALEAIGAVAADWGFGNFSQFSCDYRKLFGASASAFLKTLAGSPALAPPPLHLHEK